MIVHMHMHTANTKMHAHPHHTHTHTPETGTSTPSATSTSGLCVGASEIPALSACEALLRAPGTTSRNVDALCDQYIGFVAREEGGEELGEEDDEAKEGALSYALEFFMLIQANACSPSPSLSLLCSGRLLGTGRGSSPDRRPGLGAPPGTALGAL